MGSSVLGSIGRRFSGGRLRRPVVGIATCVLGADLLAACSSSSSSSSTTTAASSGQVLLVGTLHGHAGKYTTIQSAVDAAKPGSWILEAPGDYHGTADSTQPTDPAHGDNGDNGGVMISTADLHLRGMSRSGVVVDGTKAGSGQCSSDPAAQTYGAVGSDGKTVGRNGIVVWKANGVSIDNLTACNFLAGSGDSGNEVWWNGGADSATIGLHGYEGSYLTATYSYYCDENSAVQYGIFSSASAGPATWTQTYASNFDDSGEYVGVCQQVCGFTISHAWLEYNPPGYSGTNSGGAIVFENSQLDNNVFENSQLDNNKDGFDTNTQIAGDAPAPQNGACPNGGTSPITHTHSCWAFQINNVHDNNNPNVPESGTAGQGPTGTGMTLSGGRNDTVRNNTFSDNGAWDFLMIPYPDSGTPEYNQSCSGTGGVESGTFGCVYDPMDNALLDNHFTNNGIFKNPSNSDFGELTLNSGQPSNRFRGNVTPNGTSHADLHQTKQTCGVTTTSSDIGSDLLGQVRCDTGNGPCTPGMVYPQTTKVEMHPVPAGLPTMPNPSAGVPANAWCSGGKPV